MALIAEFWRNLMLPAHQLIGHFPRSSPRISLRLQGSWFLWCRMICSKQDLGAGCEHCSLGVPASGVPADGESVCPGPQSSRLVLPSGAPVCLRIPSVLSEARLSQCSFQAQWIRGRGGTVPSRNAGLSLHGASLGTQLASFLNCGPSSRLRRRRRRPKLQLQVWPINI